MIEVLRNNTGIEFHTTGGHDFAQGIKAGWQGAIVFNERYGGGIGKHEVGLQEGKGQFYAGGGATIVQGIVRGLRGHAVDLFLPVFGIQVCANCGEVFHVI